mmetsp:Transcript_15481/g.43345  ORF Transcript_15481/g.43345 Transcript_15481/m.43345 type:complete len:311 (-) Transcript_15481:6-938(-)
MPKVNSQNQSITTSTAAETLTPAEGHCSVAGMPSQDHGSPEPGMGTGREGRGKPTRVQQLEDALAAASGSRPSHKEFRESVAFVNKVKRHLPLPRVNSNGRQPQMVIDVAGSHGLVAMLCLALDSYDRAVVIDPARPASFDTTTGAWTHFFPEGALQAALRFDQRPLLEALPEAIGEAKANGYQATVLACHACQHLSDQVVDIAICHGARFAVMPCCHKDHTQLLKASAAALGLPLGVCMDLVTLGRATERGYAAKLATINSAITPHNRLVVGVPDSGGAMQEKQAGAIGTAEARLQKAYRRAHAPQLVV